MFLHARVPAPRCAALTIRIDPSLFCLGLLESTVLTLCNNGILDCDKLSGWYVVLPPDVSGD
jgi:hypothetical protein